MTAAPAAPWWTELRSITLHVDGETPRLWPAGASPGYREARLALVEAEAALRDQVERVAAMRRALPPGAPLPPYEFTENGGPVRLDELFGAHDQLVIYHLMLHPDDAAACAACSMFVDGLDGVERHVAQHTAFAVMAPAPLPVMQAWARTRGWRRVRLVSAAGSGFLDDLGVRGSAGGLFPAFSVHVRVGSEVRHVLTLPADFPDGSARGMDLLSPMWNLLDLLPSGRGDQDPDNTYPVADGR